MSSSGHNEFKSLHEKLKERGLIIDMVERKKLRKRGGDSQISRSGSSQPPEKKINPWDGWNGEIGKLIEPPKDIHHFRRRLEASHITEEFERSICAIVKKRCILDNLLYKEKKGEFKKKVTKIVNDFNRTLKRAGGTKCGLAFAQCQHDNVMVILEGYHKEIKKMVKSIEDAIRFYVYAQDISNIKRNFADEISNEPDHIKENFKKDFNVALDYSKTDEERNYAQCSIRGYTFLMRNQRDKILLAYVHGLKNRIKAVEERFIEYKDNLMLMEEGRRLVQSFKKAYNKCEKCKKETRRLDSADYMLNTFDPSVIKLERIGLKLLKHLESTRDPNTPHYKAFKYLLARATDCERISGQQSADQDALSTQFRACCYDIMRAVDVFLRPGKYHPYKWETAFNKAESSVYEFERVTNMPA
jgi:hypothetical protein